MVKHLARIAFVVSFVSAFTLGACTGPAGADGKDGTAGTAGTAGTNGTNGTDGTTGKSTIAKTRTEAAGANCPQGGTAIEIGLDANGNGMLDASEVQSTTYACSSGPASLTRVDTEPAGAVCPFGGTSIRTGKDTNGNGALDSGEITNTQTVCGLAPAGVFVEGDIVITNSALYEQFRNIGGLSGTLTMSNNVYKQAIVSFPNLTLAGAIDFRSMPITTTIDLPVLRELTRAVGNSAIIFNLPALTTLNMPMLAKKVSTFFAQNNPVLNECTTVRKLQAQLAAGGSPNMAFNFANNGTALDGGVPVCDPATLCWVARPDAGYIAKADGGAPDFILDGGSTKNWGFCPPAGPGNQAIASCPVLFDGGLPVKLDTQADNASLHNRAIQYWGGGAFALVATDLETDGGQRADGGWYWYSDNSPLAFYNWSPTEPNGGAVENCLVIDLASGGWSDFPCANNFAFACQVP